MAALRVGSSWHQILFSGRSAFGSRPSFAVPLQLHLSTSVIGYAKVREGAKVLSEIEKIKKRKEEKKKLSEKKREEGEITDRLVIQILLLRSTVGMWESKWR